MNTCHPSSSSEASEVSAVEFWSLDAPSRFPVTAADWDRLATLPPRPQVKVNGEHAYDRVVNRKARRPMLNTIRRLRSAFPADFESASGLFTPVLWRFLFYLDLYPLAALGDPSFDPPRAFQTVYERDEWLLDVPAEWTGATQPATDLTFAIRVAACDADSDVLKAAWTILALARSLGLSKSEVLVVPWYESWWLDRYLQTAR
jgi:hypothetical protein